MPFEISYTPISSLVEAATAAGQARSQQIAAQQSAVADRHNAAIQAQMAQAAQAADIRNQELDLRERATQLQEAASMRQDATLSARRQRISPVAQAIQARLGELNRLKMEGGIPDPVFEDARLRIITGQRTPQAPRPKVPSFAERRTESRDRAEAITMANRLSRRLSRTKNDQERLEVAEQLTELTSRATERWGIDWKKKPGAMFKTKDFQRPQRGVNSKPIPYDRSQLKRGQVYHNNRGELGVWTGKRFKNYSEN